MTRAIAIASILKKLGDAHYQAADELLALASNESGSPARLSGSGAAVVPPAAAPASLPPSIDELPFDDALIPDEFREAPLAAVDVSTGFTNQGSEAVCPAHRKPFVEGRYGLYCQSMADDPAWANKKGFCTITPRNAAQYLRVKAAA